VLVDPSGELERVEPNQVPPLDERDAAFGNEPADVTNLDAEQVGDLADADEAIGEQGRGRTIDRHGVPPGRSGGSLAGVPAGSCAMTVPI